MKRFLSLLLATSVIFGAGCAKKQNKVAQQQKEAVEKTFVEQESAGKENYSLIA